MDPIIPPLKDRPLNLRLDDTDIGIRYDYRTRI
jgi:hypothetical protein